MSMEYEVGAVSIRTEPCHDYVSIFLNPTVKGTSPCTNHLFLHNFLSFYMLIEAVSIDLGRYNIDYAPLRDAISSLGPSLRMNLTRNVRLPRYAYTGSLYHLPLNCSRYPSIIPVWIQGLNRIAWPTPGCNL